MLRDAAQWTMYLGMAIAMVGGASWPRPAWGIVGIGLAVIAVGVMMKRYAGPPPLDEGQGAVVQGVKPARTGNLEQALVLVAEEIEKLATQADTLDFEVIKKKTEDLNWLGAERVGGAQEAIAAAIGFAAYAEIMTPLATAERLLNRAWSAAADGHRPETVASIKAALPFAREAAGLAKGKLTVSALQKVTVRGRTGTWYG